MWNQLAWVLKLKNKTSLFNFFSPGTGSIKENQGKK